jgi:esterase/lipase superfamily enzyme
MDMPLVAYGHAGYPLLMFPTAAADYLEYERFHLIDAIKDFIEAGLIRAYSINSVNKYSLLNKESHPAWKVEMLSRYDKYITDEVLPLIRNECGQDARPLTTGASLGALLAANTYFKHSDAFRGTIAMSGSYDIYNYLEHHYDDNVYFNNPRMRKADSIVIVTGQGNYEAPDRSRDLSRVLHSKGIPHRLELWGHDVAHDWPWWRKMLPYYLGEFLK